MEETIKDALVDELKSKWQDCEDNSVDVFRYKLNVTREKVLDGAFKFFVQVGNPSIKLSMKSCDVITERFNFSSIKIGR